MSVQQIRKMKLLKSLEKSERQIFRSEPKRKLSTNSISFSENLRKLNKNKKYMLEEQRNTEIERSNRILYEKIKGHFDSLKDSQSLMNKRQKWRKRKCKNYTQQSDNRSTASQLINNQLKYLSRVKTNIPLQTISTLFKGIHEIDGILLNITITMNKDHYCLIAHNSNVQINLQMEAGEYMRLHQGQLQGNPCNIFKYLQIAGNKIRFREREQRNFSRNKRDDFF